MYIKQHKSCNQSVTWQPPKMPEQLDVVAVAGCFHLLVFPEASDDYLTKVSAKTCRVVLGNIELWVAELRHSGCFSSTAFHRFLRSSDF